MQNLNLYIFMSSLVTWYNSMNQLALNVNFPFKWKNINSYFPYNTFSCLLYYIIHILYFSWYIYIIHRDNKEHWVVIPNTKPLDEVSDTYQILPAKIAPHFRVKLSNSFYLTDQSSPPDISTPAFSAPSQHGGVWTDLEINGAWTPPRLLLLMSSL